MIALLRLTGIVEGLSWLLLLFVAMPLKYGFGYPEAVSIVGMAHGVLFVAFVGLLGVCHIDQGWGVGRSVRLFVAALVPFGFVFVERDLRPPEPVDGV